MRCWCALEETSDNWLGYLSNPFLVHPSSPLWVINLLLYKYMYCLCTNKLLYSRIFIISTLVVNIGIRIIGNTCIILVQMLSYYHSNTDIGVIMTLVMWTGSINYTNMGCAAFKSKYVRLLWLGIVKYFLFWLCI